VFSESIYRVFNVSYMEIVYAPAHSLRIT